MFSKLRSNYRLSNLLTRIAFVLAYVFYSWQKTLATTELALQMYNFTPNMSSSHTVVVAILSSLLMGAILMFLVPVVANVFLNISRFYNVPRAEYCLIAHLFFTLFYLVCGALNLVNLITPLLLVWGEKLFPFISATGCMIWFYAVTKRLYFNDATAKYYFRNLAILYFVVAFVFGVIL